MEGFEPEKFDEILGLSVRGFASVALCTFGYRSPDDQHALDAKVRFSRDDLIEHR
jgi:nitroreductase